MSKGALTIRRQIRSITNTKKMTKAMELVSASKMRKAVSATLATRPYASAAGALLAYLAPHADRKLHPLLQERERKNIGIVMISTNRGLCGGFNNALAQAVFKIAERERALGVEKVELVTAGRRGRDICARFGSVPLIADFEKRDVTTSVQDIAPIIYTVVQKYTAAEWDACYLVTTDFVSSVRQQVVEKMLLPFRVEADQNEIERTRELFAPFMFEPSDEQVLRYIIPRILETQVYQAVLESEASEHSARMLAMHNASEAATDMLAGLRLTYNQARQAAITQEIAEISSGKAALE
jgi:F-type H+-transporting ATPase subunit gamma